MAKKPSVLLPTEATALTHNPFASLKEKKLPELPSQASTGMLNPDGPSAPAPVRRSDQPAKKPKAPPPPKLRLRLETKGRSGKVVTRVTGLPVEHLEIFAAHLKKALGCGAVVEEQDLILLGSLVERAERWFDSVGDLRAFAANVAAPSKTQSMEAALASSPSSPSSPSSFNAPDQARGLPPGFLSSATPAHTASAVTGTRRGELRRGQRVAIVMKADQASGKLTEGLIRDILTNSENHPRGIMVRLESGEIGRVKIAFD